MYQCHVQFVEWVRREPIITMEDVRVQAAEHSFEDRCRRIPIRYHIIAILFVTLFYSILNYTLYNTTFSVYYLILELQMSEHNKQRG